MECRGQVSQNAQSFPNEYMLGAGMGHEKLPSACPDTSQNLAWDSSNPPFLLVLQCGQTPELQCEQTPEQDAVC